MGTRHTVYCNTVYCKYNSGTQPNGKRYCCYNKPITLEHGKCQSYEHGFMYYISHFISQFDNSNMLPIEVLSDKDVTIGGYYAMHIFNLAMIERGHGSWRWVHFVSKNDPEEKYLKGSEILDQPLNEEEFHRLWKLWEEGKLPPFENEQKEIEEHQKKLVKLIDKEFNPEWAKLYGLLSPDGVFYPAPWGEHTNKAYEIVKSNSNWKAEYRISKQKTPLDFLIYERHFVLIHNPSMLTNDIRVNQAPGSITKKQTDFLYSYFMNRGMTLVAERFLEEKVD